MKAGWTISAALHGAVLAWGLVTFATRPLSAPPPDFISTDIISASDFSQITNGIKTAPKAEAPKPLVEKVAEAKPVEEQNAKIVDNKPEIVATSDRIEPPKPLEPEKKKAEPKPSDAAAAGQARAEAGVRQGAGAEDRSDCRGSEERYQEARSEDAAEGGDAAEEGRAAETAAQVRCEPHRGAARQARSAAQVGDRRHAEQYACRSAPRPERRLRCRRTRSMRCVRGCANAGTCPSALPKRAT